MELKLPLVLKNRILLKAGLLNGEEYPFEEIQKALPALNSKPKTVDDRNQASLFWDHEEKKANKWVGDIKNFRAESRDKTLRGDVSIVDEKAAQALQYQLRRGFTSWGISPRMLVNMKDKRAFDIEFKGFNLVPNPGGGLDLMLSEAFNLKLGGEKIMEIFGESYEFKLGTYGYPDYKYPTPQYGYPKSQYGYYPSVSRLSEVYFLLDKLIAGEKDEKIKAVLQEIKGILKHWTGQAYPYPKIYPYPKAKAASENEGQMALADGNYAVPAKPRMKEINFLVDKLIAGEKDADAKAMLQEVKALLSRMEGGDFPYPKTYPYPKSVKASKEGDFITEAVTVDWIEEDAEKPFKFIGKALKVDGKTKNNRWYGRSIVDVALKEAKEIQEKGERLTIMAGHPKKGDTNPLQVIGKVGFGEIGDDDWVPYEAELADTSDGKCAQTLLRGNFIGDVSLRSRGHTEMEKIDGEPVEKVKDLHLKGLDLVIEGAVAGAGVDNILNAMGGEFDMGTTIEELKKERPDLVEAIRTEEKDKLHKDIEKSKKDLKETKEAKEKFEKELKEAKEKFEKDLKEAKEGKGGKGDKDAAEKKIGDLEKKVKDLGEQVVNLEAEKKLRESKEVYVTKLKKSGLTEDMVEGLEELCLGKKPEDMDKIIEARVELVKKVTKSEVIGQTEKKDKTDKEKLEAAEKAEAEVLEAFGGKKKEEKKE